MFAHSEPYSRKERFAAGASSRQSRVKQGAMKQGCIASYRYPLLGKGAGEMDYFCTSIRLRCIDIRMPMPTDSVTSAVPP